ncbi:hypothetical protein ACH5RR_032915 [Cinchona calisaya]|uniref:Uncharacterized protein n=1 Tax=Cinchona calisaya TaxID=153742 RepID=A0ABD2YKM8_9GENT
MSETAMVEAALAGVTIEKLRQLLAVRGIESLKSELEEMVWLLKRIQEKQLLLWIDREEEDGDEKLKELVYDVDDLVDEIIYCLEMQTIKSKSKSQRRRGWSQNFWLTLDKSSLIHNLFQILEIIIPSSKLLQGEDVAAFTRRIRLVNARLLSKASGGIGKAVIPEIGGQRECGGGAADLDFDGGDDDFWKSSPVDLGAAADDDYDNGAAVVGMDGSRKELISRLLANDDKEEQGFLKVVSIWGMGGIGKTTLANQVYNDFSVRSHFDCIAWANVGKDFHTRTILEDLLLQNLFCRNRDDMMPFSDLDLAQKLYESLLQKKRYLIVLDDVWAIDAWDCLRIAFPSITTASSRVLLTTRDSQVALKIASSLSSSSVPADKGFVHPMRCLNPDESWELLRKTALRGHSFSDSKVDAELVDIGKDIVNHCKGLPLAIKLMAGLLASKPNTLQDWKMVHRSLVSCQTMDDQGSQGTTEISRILALSYDLLPYRLKPCFLYMGVFPERAEISTKLLCHLWLAEGFIPSAHGLDQGSMMDVAERYLDELVIRSMVLVQKQDFSTSRRLKYFRVHNLLRDFCLLKAKEQSFCDTITFRRANDKELGSSSPISAPRIWRLALSFEDGCVVPDNWNSGKCLQYVTSPPKLSDLKDLSRLRGLYLSGFNYKVLRLPSVKGELFPRRFLSLRHLPQVLSDLANFKCLRVLLFSGFNFDVTMFPTGIEKLFRLRYLSMRDCNISRLPSTLGSLLNLEALDLGEGTWITMLIPNELQKLSRLRHLYLPHTYKAYEADKLELDGLVRLETLVNFDSRQCRVKDLRKFTKLRKLVARIDGNFQDLEEIIDCINTGLDCLRFLSLNVRTYDSENCFVIHKLLGCVKLHVLQIEGRTGKLPLWISQSLTEINLSDSELDDDPMEKLEKLPNLSILVLRNNAFLGKHMTCSPTGMLQLKYLSLSTLQNLENLTVQKGGMPKLSTLVLEGCQSLNKLPEGLSFLASLQELTVSQMPSAFMDRLNKTGEDFPKFQHAPVIRVCS